MKNIFIVCVLMACTSLSFGRVPSHITKSYTAGYSFKNALLDYNTVDQKLKSNSTDKQALFERGMIYYVIASQDKNYWMKAITAWDDYLRLYPTDANALWNRAYTKHHANIGDACADFKSALKLVKKKKELPKEEFDLFGCN